MDRDVNKNLDVLFVNPPFFRFIGKNCDVFPLGLGYLVSCLKQVGVESLIYNADYSDTIYCHKKYIINKLRVRSQKFFGKGFAKVIGNKFFDKLEQNIENEPYDEYKERAKFHKRIRHKDHKVWLDFKKVINKMQPKIVGFSAKMIDIPTVFIMAEIVKKNLPNTKVFVGGAASSTCSDILIKNKNIDFLILGEGEITCNELVQSILNSELSSQDFSKIDGIIYKKSNQIIKNKQRLLIDDLDSVPFPDRESMFYLDKNNQVEFFQQNDVLISSRGCPYPCKFCACHAVWNTKKPRVRSNDDIIEEMLHLYNNHNQRFFAFVDDLFTIDKAKVIDFCNKIKQHKMDTTWFCLARLNNIDSEMLSAMKASGCIELAVGIESGSDRMLKYMGKVLTKKLIREKTKVIKESGIAWRGFFMIGLPTETKEEINETLKFLKEIDPPSRAVAIFSPYPGSSFYEELKAQKKVKKNFLSDDLFYVNNNYTGTMSDKEFKKIASDALKLNKLTPVVPNKKECSNDK